MKKKYCTTCETDVNVDEFRKNKAKKDGLQEKCIPCDKAYAKEYYERNKKHCIDRSMRNQAIFREKYQAYKDDLVCTICGEDENICLDFHHLESDEKEHNISELVKKGSWNLLMEEVNKCIVVCSNCHRKIHKYGLEQTKQRTSGREAMRGAATTV